MKTSLQLRLSVVVSLAILLAALAGAGSAFRSARHEAQELQDDTLRQVAELIASQDLASSLRPGVGKLRDSREDPRLIITRYDGGQRNMLPLPSGLPDGLRSVTIGSEEYRVFIARLARGDRIAVAERTSFRDEVARDNVKRTLLPMALLVPSLILLVAALVRHAFGPVGRLAGEIEGRDASALHSMSEDGLPREVRPFVAAINRLLARVSATMMQQRRFIADAAHELRSPLAALSLQAERLAALDLDEAARARLDVLLSGIARNRRLLDQLLDLARVQSANEDPAGQTPSVQAVFRDVIEDAMPLALAGNVDLGVVGTQDASVPIAQIDLTIMLRNLVSNAVRNSPVGARVDLMLEVAGETVRVCVLDEGPGIPEAQMERIFEPFYRIPGSRGIGSGLGLSIVQAITQKNDAQISLANRCHSGGYGLCAGISIKTAE